jgi:hypothetical protein
MKTFIYYLAERVAGQQEMQRFAHPIHVGIVSANSVVDAYSCVVEDLKPTFADHSQLLEARFEEMSPPRHRPADASKDHGPGVWLHHHPIDMDITFTDDD